LCLAGRRFAFIDARGDVYPCLSFKTAGDGTRLGNIRDTPFAEIWRAHPMLSAIRAATRDSFGRCATCTGACSPCMAANFEEHGELFTPARARCHARRLPVLT
jgi:radical SAM protein with 4Fe4S-binding SPASM domain